MTNSRKCSLLDKLVFESVGSIDFGEAAMGNGISDEMGKDSTSASDTLEDSDISLCLPYLCYLSQRLCAEQPSSSSEILNCSAEKVPWSFLEPLGNAGALKRFVQSIVESRQIFSYLSLDIKNLVKSVRETLSQGSESLSSSQMEFTAKNSESKRHPFEEGTDAERIMLIAADLISASPISNSSALGDNEYVDEAGIITALIYLSCPSVAPIRQLFSRLSLLPTFEIIAMTLIYNLPERFFEICSVLVAGFCEGNQKYKEIVFSLIPRGELISRQIREEAEKYPLSTNVMTLILATTLESIKDTVHYFYGRVRNDAPFLRSLSMVGGLTLICDTLVERLGEREDLCCGLALLCCLRTVEKGLNERETGVIVDISNDPASSQEIHKMILFYFLIFPEAINLISKKSDVVHSIVSHCPPEILLQVVSSLRVNSMRTIETVISGLLGLPVNLNISSSFGTFRDALTREFISPTFCDDFLHPLPIVMCLNHFSVTQIPKCVSAIIISGIAKERNVDISDYIWKQAVQCTKPVRSDFVEAIRLYAKQLNSLGTATFARISQDNIIALFNGKLDQLCACPMTAKLLILEYVLGWNSDCFQDNVLQLLQNTLFFSCIREKVLDYNKCKSKESEYITTAFTSQLMGQLISRCPQLFEPEHELDLAFLRQEKIIRRTLPRSFTAEELGNPRFVGRCFTRVTEQPERVYLVLLSIKPNKDTLPFISALFPLIIGNVVIEEQWLKVWKEAFESWTAYVAEMTLIALSVWTARQHNFTPDEFLAQATTTMSKSSSSIVSDAYADPLTILRLDKCFLVNVRGIDIILELLSYFLTASRKKIFAQIKAQVLFLKCVLNGVIAYLFLLID